MKIRIKEFKQAENKEAFLKDKIAEQPDFWKDLPKMRIIPSAIKAGGFVFEILRKDEHGECWEAFSFDTYDKCLKYKVEFIERWKNWQIEERLNGRR